MIHHSKMKDDVISMTAPQSLKWDLSELITGFKNTESLF